MFLSVNDFDRSIFIPLSDVSGVEPSVFVDGFCRLFRVVVITYYALLMRRAT